MNDQPDVTGLFCEFHDGEPRINELTPFEFEGYTIHVTDRDGNPWWVLPDVCKPLGIATPRDAAGRLDDDEKGVAITDTLGGKQPTTIINESGLYSLILTSRKPAAKRFKKWVTATVLPSIRRTGAYSLHQADQLPLSPQNRHILGGIMKRVAASQNRPIFHKLEVMEQEIVAIKAVSVERVAGRDYGPMLEIVKAADIGPRGGGRGAFLRLQHHRHPGRHRLV